jgi:SAM-dependent methyltransferase
MNRYPMEYKHLKAILEEQALPKSIKERKILSFGCSTGEEPLSLAQLYFTSPEVKIFGVDVADKAINAAIEKAKQEPEGKITIIDGRVNSPKMYGPFDIVLANSVFCIYGSPGVPYKNITYVMEHFSYDTFQNVLAEINSYLKVGGVLAIHNSNYNFMDTKLYVDKYEVIKGMECPGHFVPRIDLKEKKFVDVGSIEIECLYRKMR